MTTAGKPDVGVLLHDVLAPIAGLVGSFSGEGRGDYPTIDPFTYRETVTVGHVGKPFLAYAQRTSHPETGAPMHAESGYLRLVPPSTSAAGVGVDPDGGTRVEFVLAHPTGLVEVEEGGLIVDASGVATFDLSTTTVGRAGTAKDVREVRRRFVLDGDVLTYDVWMAHADTPLTHHLAAVLRRDR
ncbi:MAG: FABP family protein [Nitriliruptor sp.]|uniref:FABP family protein n=1 Tax=Nitriliruptor sp. TaxID=2448056 RepID=UPI0034A02F32